MSVRHVVDCDVCKHSQEMSPADSKKKEVITVVFTTEQTEGRSCAPYLSNESLDLCDTCKEKVIEGNMLFAHGAQGHNTYYFKKETS